VACIGDAHLYEDDEGDDDDDAGDLSGDDGSGRDIIDNPLSPQHMDSIYISTNRRRILPPPPVPRNPPLNVDPNRHFVDPSLRRQRPMVYTAPTVIGPVINRTTTTTPVYYNTRRSNYYYSGGGSTYLASISSVVVVSSMLVSSFIILCQTVYIGHS